MFLHGRLLKKNKNTIANILNFTDIWTKRKQRQKISHKKDVVQPKLDWYLGQGAIKAGSLVSQCKSLNPFTFIALQMFTDPLHFGI